MVCRNFILPEICKPCLFIFVKLILPDYSTSLELRFMLQACVIYRCNVLLDIKQNTLYQKRTVHCANIWLQVTLFPQFPAFRVPLRRLILHPLSCNYFFVLLYNVFRHGMQPTFKSCYCSFIQPVNCKLCLFIFVIFFYLELKMVLILIIIILFEDFISEPYRLRFHLLLYLHAQSK